MDQISNPQATIIPTKNGKVAASLKDPSLPSIDPRHALGANGATDKQLSAAMTVVKRGGVHAFFDPAFSVSFYRDRLGLAARLSCRLSRLGLVISTERAPDRQSMKLAIAQARALAEN